MCGPGGRALIARARPSAATKAKLDRKERAMSDTLKWLAVAELAAAELLLYLLGPMLTPFLVAAGVLGSGTSSGLAVIAWLANLVLIPLVTFYLLRDWDVMIAHIGELIPPRHAPLVKQLARDCDRVLSGFLRGQLSVMAALGTVYTVGLWLVGLDLALLSGAFAGTVSFVPYLVFILGVSFATIAVLMQYHDVFHLLLVF